MSTGNHWENGVIVCASESLWEFGRGRVPKGFPWEVWKDVDFPDMSTGNGGITKF